MFGKKEKEKKKWNGRLFGFALFQLQTHENYILVVLFNLHP
jgi:hypothetical protein